MATSVYKLEKDLCRCCHAEGTFSNLSEPVYNLGHKEVYSEMLKFSLDVEMKPVPGELSAMTFTICEACISRVRDAHNFKQQVLLCEQRFKNMYRSIIVEPQVNINVKEESLVAATEVKMELEPDVDDDDNDGYEMKFDDSDDDQPVIKIKVEEARKTRAKPKPSKTKSKKKVTKSATKSKSLISEDSSQDHPADGEKKTVNKGVRTKLFALKNEDYRTDDTGSFTCNHCQKAYNKFYSLRFHIKNTHYKVPRYFCTYCKKGFMTPAPLTVHKLEVHKVDDRFTCKACNAAFNTKVQLRKHTNNFHMLGEKYKCEFCEYESFSFEGMYKHKFKHRTEKNYHCRFCKKSFLRKATLDLHERIHTGDKRKVCKVCGQAFVQKASLNYHMTKYHPEVNF